MLGTQNDLLDLFSRGVGHIFNELFVWWKIKIVSKSLAKHMNPRKLQETPQNPTKTCHLFLKQTTDFRIIQSVTIKKKNKILLLLRYLGICLLSFPFFLITFFILPLLLIIFNWTHYGWVHGN